MGTVTSLERESTLQLVMVASRVADILPSMVALAWISALAGKTALGKDELGRYTVYL